MNIIMYIHQVGLYLVRCVSEVLYMCSPSIMRGDSDLASWQMLTERTTWINFHYNKKSFNSSILLKADSAYRFDENLVKRKFSFCPQYCTAQVWAPVRSIKLVSRKKLWLVKNTYIGSVGINTKIEVSQSELWTWPAHNKNVCQW